jgi:hypothetical protein
MSKKTGEPSVENYQIEGHSVQISKEDNNEQLWIDGIRHRFSVTKDGYNLYERAYAPPEKSLLEAVKAYLKQISKKKESS